MISVNKYFKQDLFQNNEKILYSVSNQVTIQPISLTYFEARVVSTKDFDNNYGKQLDYCYDDSRAIIDEFFNEGFSAFIFEIGPFLTPERLQRINNFAPFSNLRKQGLANVNNIQKCYEFPDGIKYAGIFSVNKDCFYKGCVYIQGTTNAVIIFSKRNNVFSENNLDKLFYSSIFVKDNTRINYLNWVTLCLEACPQGDFIVNVGGGYDDLYRSILFYYCQNTLSTELRDLLLLGTEIRPNGSE